MHHSSLSKMVVVAAISKCHVGCSRLFSFGEFFFLNVTKFSRSLIYLKSRFQVIFGAYYELAKIIGSFSLLIVKPAFDVTCFVLLLLLLLEFFFFFCSVN
jgi:hypothetical protein